MSSPPTFTAIGSCRVYDPLSAMQAEGRAKLNQQRIFGFVHNSREILQQLRFITGEVPLPGRLRKFLNIPPAWKWQSAEEAPALEETFAETDVFVVEVSSIRLLRFKALFLQLNRTRELLVSSEAIEQRWWLPLTRDGRNEPLSYLIANMLSEMEPVHREVMEQLACVEQTATDLVRDLKAIQDVLPRPVLFVSHFNANPENLPIHQRQVIVDAMRDAKRRFGIEYLDPTDLVLDAGLGVALEDAAHYRADFHGVVGAELVARAQALLRRTVGAGQGDAPPDKLAALITALR